MSSRPLEVLFAAALLLAGCGQKGPLFLPAQGVPAAASTSVTEPAAPSTSIATPARPASAPPTTGTASPVRQP
jgi:predicted small lipoprotein YifL